MTIEATHDTHWQIQEAKQRFSELIRAVQSDGPQFVTKHGEDVAVVIDIEEYRRFKGETMDFKEFLLSGPTFDDIEFERSPELPRVIDFSDDV
jgi:prevent-host-death family protein